MARHPAGRLHLLRAAYRHIYARRHVRCDHPTPRLASGAGGHRSGDHAGGAAKLFTIAKALGVRRKQPALFSHGSYEPLMAEGQYRENVCASARELDGQRMIVVVPRLVAELLNGETQMPLGKNLWADTALLLPEQLQHRTYRDVFSEATITPQAEYLAIADVFCHFPVALLISG